MWTKEAARKGALRAKELGTAHRFTSEEARIAGRKGGNIVSKDKKWMQELGRRGAAKRKQNLLEQKNAMNELSQSHGYAV